MLKRNLLALAVASVLVSGVSAYAADSAGSPPYASGAAQQGADQAETATSTPAQNTAELGEIKVTGIRHAIETAIETKQQSTSIVEAVSAEDIGKLPDISIAESIARLPGLAAQRVAGRAQVISVRGLSPDFSTTLLNGREMVSTGDNRSVEFDQYPSELISGVTVYKTPDAGLIGQGLSGTIDMQTVRPLDFNNTVVSVGARGQHNSLGSAANESANGNRFNATYIGRFADHTFGVALGFAHTDIPVQEEQVGLYDPWKKIGDGWRPGVPADTYYSDGIKALRRTGDTKRDGAMATLEWKPSDAWTSTLDLFHSKSRAHDTANQFEVNLGDYNGDHGRIDITNPVINGNGTFVGGTAANLYPLVRGIYDKRDDKIDAFGWKNEFKAGIATIVADVSYSKAKRNETNLETNTQLLPVQLDTLTLAYRSNDFSQLAPGLDYSDPTKLYFGNSIYGTGYGKLSRVSDELKSFRVVGTIPSPDFTSKLFSNIDFGINYADREKDKHQPEASFGINGDPTTIGPELQYSPVDLGFAGVGFIPAWNVPGVVARYATFTPSETAFSYLIPKAWAVSEKLSTYFLKGDIDSSWGSVPVRGNVGLQLQHTDQSSSANVWDSSQPSGHEVRPFSDGTTYNDVLPSMNLAFGIAEDQWLRVALAKQVARPRVDQMRASLEFGVDNATGKPGGSGGNPRLDPWRANAFDLSWEKYFADNKGYVAAAFFYKDLTSYIFTQSRDGYDFSALLEDYVPPPNSAPVLTHGTFSAPYNGKGGKLDGIELSASVPLDMLTPVLNGFGVIASATFTNSSIKILAPENSARVGNDPITLPGLSKRVYNVTAYYENNGWEARISQRRRSDFIGEISNTYGERTLNYVVGENITDAQLSYAFADDSTLHGLSLLLQAQNLTDSAYRTYATTKDRPLEYIKWGRTILFGATYKF